MEVRSAPAYRAGPPETVYYSSATEGDIGRSLGLTHYSYRFAEAKFLAAFAAAGWQPRSLKMPEYYASRQALGGGAEDDPDGTLIHLIFRSTEQIRVLKPAFNIACFAWEFAVMKDWSGPADHPFLDQRRMLSLCDEIWVPCRFTRDVLRAHGIDRVHLIPAPVAAQAAPRMKPREALVRIGHLGAMPLDLRALRNDGANAAAMRAGERSLVHWLAPRFAAKQAPKIYLTIFNPDDLRKNVDALLRGFDYFRHTHPEAVLLVKILVSRHRLPLERAIAELVKNRLDEDSSLQTENILFFADYLDDRQMRALFCLADFYLCASMAEGQNLPLLEAMAEGTVPVTTCNTAMLDYIDPDIAFVIQDNSVPAPIQGLAGAIAGRAFDVALCRAHDVLEALRQSASASTSRLQAMGRAAKARVGERFGPDTVWPLIAERLAGIGAADSR